MIRLDILFSVPKTVYFNFRYLPWKHALKLPIWIATNVRVRTLKGNIVLPPIVNFAMIRIGYHTVPIMDIYSAHTIINIERGGRLYFAGRAHIGMGTKISIAKNGILSLGDNFAISALCQINCYKSITFGRDIQFSWECLIMDSDTHRIYDVYNECSNRDEGIYFNDKIWIGCRTTILKGTTVASGCVIGANSLLTRKYEESNSIIAGNPAKQIKKIARWEL